MALRYTIVIFLSYSMEANLNQRHLKALSFLIVLLLLVGSYVPAARAANLLKPRWVPPKPEHTDIEAWQSKNVIEVKFVEGSSYRLVNGQMTAPESSNPSALQAVLRAHPVRTMMRLFTQDETQLRTNKLEAETMSGEQMPDLSLWYLFTASAGTDVEALIDALNALPQVEIAYPQPLPAPLPGSAQKQRFTPSYLENQGYLNVAPGGIDAKYAWQLGGGTGKNVTIVDVEYSFNQTHEDLKSVSVIGLPMYHAYGDDHGTAVQGELIGKPNDYGVTGIAYGATSKFSSPCLDSVCSYYIPAFAISVAQSNTVAGDVILIEQQTPVCGLSYYGPLEWVQSVYDAIKTATASGRNVIEAAGNGEVWLDQPACNNLFSKSVRDSGAIIVGAGTPPGFGEADRARAYFSTFGSRVNVQGWGFNVVTTGYGDLQNGDPNEWYTSGFSGTSSASPIVAGTVALLSSIAKQRGSILSPTWLRSVLITTGSPQQAALGAPLSQHIGPRPNLRKALTKLPAGGFNSQFTEDAQGWSPVNSTWTMNTAGNGLYITNGAPKTYWHTVSHVNNYTSFTYEVRMKRTTCGNCANHIIIRGTPSPVNAAGVWSNGYMFSYQNSSTASPASGGWAGHRIQNGAVSGLHSWTATPHVVPYNFNTLKVVANGTSLAFYINDQLVWSGTDSTLTSGQVGIGMYQGHTTETMGGLQVDWAKLVPIAVSGSIPPTTTSEIFSDGDTNITGFAK